MDILYTGDIPQEYCYGVFYDDYIRLFNVSFAQNQTLSYYDVFIGYDGFYYRQGTQTFSQYSRTYFTYVPVSDNWLYRQDIDKIFTVVFIICLMFIFVFNIVTSVFKKGGVFGGLL